MSHIIKQSLRAMLAGVALAAVAAAAIRSLRGKLVGALAPALPYRTSISAGSVGLVTYYFQMDPDALYEIHVDIELEVAASCLTAMVKHFEHTLTPEKLRAAA